jgi:hypothetical protein
MSTLLVFALFVAVWTAVLVVWPLWYLFTGENIEDFQERVHLWESFGL